ncbi:MAG: hypothetical protein DCF27_12665 [Lysobacteraceae bacterium]|jgi:hypothetical protein|nr:MAG: hypothetical protein DCF27_12665 [Xanthomonadaceae bacterium]
MNSDWVHSSNHLPDEGQHIGFMLHHRNVAMEGTFLQQAFRSHWADYAVERVSSWRSVIETDGPADTGAA